MRQLVGACFVSARATAKSLTDGGSGDCVQTAPRYTAQKDGPLLGANGFAAPKNRSSRVAASFGGVSRLCQRLCRGPVASLGPFLIYGASWSRQRLPVVMAQRRRRLDVMYGRSFLLGGPTFPRRGRVQ